MDFFYRATALESVSQSVCRTRVHNKRNFCWYFYTIWKSYHPSFPTIMFGGATPCTWNFGPNWPCFCKIADFQSIIARSASTVTPANNVQLSVTSSLMSLRWTAYVAPKLSPKEGSKTQ